MSGELCLLNHQRTRAIDLRLLRRIIGQLLVTLEETDFDLTIHLVNADTMSSLNATHLQHAGSTDVITLDYSDAAQSVKSIPSPPPSPLIGAREKKRLRTPSPPLGEKDGMRGTAGSSKLLTHNFTTPQNLSPLTGELFVCVDEALLQARKFRVTWQSELVRYIVHGVLHLQGHDDLQPAPRRRMKLEENRRVRELTRNFSLGKLQRKTGTKS